MNITDVITGGFVGSVFTLIIKAIIDACCSHIAYKRELRKQVFQRKTDAVERAMSWYQEALDMYTLLQAAIKEYDGTANPVTIEKIQYSGIRLDKLLQETSIRLNPVYLYYDFTDILQRFHIMESAKIINEAFVLIGEIQQHLPPVPAINEQELEVRKQWFGKLKETLDIAASAMNGQILSITAIQQRLREDYQKYTK